MTDKELAELTDIDAILEKMTEYAKCGLAGNSRDHELAYKWRGILKKFIPQSAQHTKCSVCLEDKPTPIRNDAMGGYVCLTCVDKELERLQEEVERAYLFLTVYGVSRERAKTIANGIDVLETRYRKDINAANAELASFSFIPAGRENEIACHYAACDWGQGLAGMGRCSGHGNPRDPQCPMFTTEAGDYNGEENK
jgi:hypothetical protein